MTERLVKIPADAGDDHPPGGPVGLTTRIDAVVSAAAMVFMEVVRAVAERVRAQRGELAAAVVAPTLQGSKR